MWGYPYSIIFDQPKAMKKKGVTEMPRKKKQPTIDKSILSLINRRERQLLVHSYIYYELDDSIIPDDQWSKWGFELCSLRDKYPEEYELSEYAMAFRHFDGSTGFDLYGFYMHSHIINKALYLLRINKKGMKTA